MDKTQHWHPYTLPPTFFHVSCRHPCNSCLSVAEVGPFSPAVHRTATPAAHLSPNCQCQPASATVTRSACGNNFSLANPSTFSDDLTKCLLSMLHLARPTHARQRRRP